MSNIEKNNRGTFLIFTGIVLIGSVISACHAKEVGVRKEAVKGTFYPAGKTELKRMIEGYLSQAEKEPAAGEIAGIIVPHAGYIYSGPVAAYSYRYLEGEKYDTVILLGGSHRVGYSGCALDPHEAWQTPLGKVDVDRELAQRLTGAPFILSAQPHEAEHSLEVQIPFLQTVLEPGFKIVPLLFGQDRESWKEAASRL
ncbi:MAG TPA: AmmeMemoRadiSam system protein B, partial [bacterium]|nr:AmmeMemoRadiSam system protein B [bacterium]